MISRIAGRLIEARDGHALLECDHLVYEILVPGCDIAYLNSRCGTAVVFHTLHYHESHGQGSSFVPRLVGFHNERDRAFFELFTTVKNIGYRKALRALQLPFDRVAAAIAGKDASFLTTLPEIGKRTAETIIAELSGKVDDFIEDVPAVTAEDDDTLALIGDTVAMLTALGESRSEAQSLAQRALAVEPKITTPDALLSVVFRLRETIR
ncbi:MAG: Holliday junction branch migration protein RuvA [Planctomycetota bacterium]|nr:Holliday junction branch migration protein RuvA [Planctomycetota bacterium]